MTSAGWTAIHMASRFGHLDCVKKLIVAGSNLNARSYSLTTPLHEAAQGGPAQARGQAQDGRGGPGRGPPGL